MERYYLEYNSTINCSLIVSGISSLVGTVDNLPVNEVESHSIQGYLLTAPLERLSVITSRDLEYGRYNTKLDDDKWIRIFSEFDEIITYPPFKNSMDSISAELILLISCNG